MSEQISAAERAGKASRAEHGNEFPVPANVRTSEQMSEWPSTYVPILDSFEPPLTAQDENIATSREQ